ncbi:hypothetical membrane spanning protein [Marinomonas sp. MED121]|uniref:membrane spanning protein n=1 Tax=Marinomonas sp. MED121 TaxID=314277 RepID=UPI000069116C|nr:membrane spanning protein [Marinomonas sp. MED121]EAQ67568.1 hypothetical membrane spanning protein [Marinomonas sp. MED121]
MDEVSSLVKDSLTFYRHHIGAISRIILPCIIPLNLLYALAGVYSDDLNQQFWLTSTVGLIVYPLYQGALIAYMASVISGDPLTRGQCYGVALNYWRPLFLLSVLVSLALMTGLFLFILPGFYIMARLAFSEFYCVLNKQAPFTALEASWNATKGIEWRILLGGVTLLLITLLPVWLIENLFALLALEHVIITFIISVFESLLWVTLTVFAYRVFCLNQAVNK